MVLVNADFELGWTDIVTHGRAQQQQPTGWRVGCLPIGARLRSAGVFPHDHPPVIETVTTIPEIKHYRGPLNGIGPRDLPVEECRGGSRALVLSGSHCFGMFSSAGAFSGWLEQDVVARPGELVEITLNLQVHGNPIITGDFSPGACAWRASLGDTYSSWHTFGSPTVDRQWEQVTLRATVSNTGKLLLKLELESRSEAGINFFMDDFRAEVIPTGILHPRIDYARTFLLLPQNLSAHEYMTLMGRLSNDIIKYRWTVGFSADDAGIGAGLLERQNCDRRRGASRRLGP
jgi:hypothetical protein